ncbi:MAG: FAD-dependent oxidoreductase [Atopobiaceae bacterium]|jgi:thioredoxin reductase (NADPH)
MLEETDAQASDNIYDAVIIGGGPAGLTAAIYLARARYRVLVVEKDEFGGQINITDSVVNYPGVFATSGRELTETMRRQAEAFGAEFLLAEVTNIQVDGDVKQVKTSRGSFEALSVLVATGAHPREVGFVGEKNFQGHGVAYCATCDGEFFTGREVFVVGGGFAAAEESVFLTKYASHVHVLVRTDDFTCAEATAEATKKNPKIDITYNAEVVAVEGDTAVRTIRWKDRTSGQEQSFTADEGIGVFVFVGYAPATDVVKDLVKLDDHGYVLTNEHQETSVAGIFAAGDVCVKPLRQVATAIGQAATTATEMERAIVAAQHKTGRAGTQRASRVEAAAGNGAATGASPAASAQAASTTQSASTAQASSAASSGDVFDADTVAQLQTVFSRMAEPVQLKLYLDDSDKSRELKAYADAMAQAGDKIVVKKASADGVDGSELPYVEVCRKDGSASGLEFHGVPGGHEFTSFILGLYNVAGPGQPIADEDRAAIAAIADPLDIKVLVGLSCTMCPETVVSAQRVAADNAQVTAHVYDVALHPELKDRYDVMSVPCVVVTRKDGEHVSFGKKTLPQMIELLK